MKELSERGPSYFVFALIINTACCTWSWTTWFFTHNDNYLGSVICSGFFMILASYQTWIRINEPPRDHRDC